MATSTLSGADTLYSFSQLHEMGYGHRHTLTKLVDAGILPAVMTRGGYRVKESDLHYIVDAKRSKKKVDADFFAREPTMGDYIKALVDTFPTLDAESKAELGRLLSPAT